MITKSQFCYESLISLSRPGGEALSLREDSIDPLRSGIYIEILKGDTYTSSLVRGKVIGLLPSQDTSPIEDGCFEEGCASSNGIWSSDVYSSPYIDTFIPSSGAFEQGCVSTDCVEDFELVCKERLPYSYQGNSTFFYDSNGAFRFRGLVEEDCNNPSSNNNGPSITTDPFSTSYTILGTRLLSTYSTDLLDIHIEESTYFDQECFDEQCFDKTYYVYASIKDSTNPPCLDECSLNCQVLIGIYNSELELISTAINSLYNNINIINDQFLSDDGLEEDSIGISNIYDFLLNNPSLTFSEIKELGDLALDIHIYLSDIGINPVQTLLGSYLRLPNQHTSCDYLCSERVVQRSDGRRTRYRYNQSILERWVTGLSTVSEDYIYVVDIGHLHPITYEPVIDERDVPIRRGNYFTSSYLIPEGIKIVILKRVYTDNSKSILHHLFGYQYNQPLIRTNTKPLLLYNALDQEVDLEELSISLICLLLSEYRPGTNCSEIDSLNKQLIDLIEDNLSTLSSLIDRFSDNGRIGSIPKTLCTYSSTLSLYDDRPYLHRDISPFEDLVIENNCYSSWSNNTLSSRQVSNRAMAWYLYLLCIYKKVTSSSKYDSDIELVATYLINQVDIRSSLVTEGWSHSDKYRDSSKVLNYLTSTSLMTCMALMKAHDLTLNPFYIDKAADIYESSYNYLYSLNEGIFYHSYTDPSLSNDSLIYGLLFSHATNKSEAIEEILKIIKARTKPLESSTAGNLIITSEGFSVRSSTGARLKSYNSESLDVSLQLEPSSALAIYPLNPYQELAPAIKDVNLIEDLLDLCKSKAYPIEFEPFISVYRERLDKAQIDNRYINTSTNLSRCLSSSILKHPLFLPNSYWDIETLLFNRNLVLERIKKLIPIDYTWPSKQAISPSGNIGRLLKTFSKSLSNWWVGIRRAKKGIYLSTATDTYIDTWASQFGVERYIREDDDSLRRRIQSFFMGGNVTEEDFINLLYSLGVDASIQNTKPLGYISFLESNLDSQHGQGQYSGPLTNTSTITISTTSPFSARVLNLINEYKPLGLQIQIQEKIQLLSCNQSTVLASHYISIGNSIFSPEYSSFCCLSPYQSGRRYPVKIDLGTTYNYPLYVYASLEEDKVVIQVSQEPDLNNLIGIIRSNQSEATFIIPSYFF